MNSRNNILYPPAKLGVIGGGQLGRMFIMEAKRMGYHVTVLDPQPKSPAGQIADRHIQGDYSDVELIKKLAQNTDVITYEFEHINTDILCELEEEGYKIIPSGHTLKKIQNKYEQKSLLMKKGLSVPKFWKAESIKEIDYILQEQGFPFFIKSEYGAYDGKGNYLIRCREDAEEALEILGNNPFFIEEYIDFKKEISVIAAVDTLGNKVMYPVVENLHEDSILRLSKIPANVNDSVKEEALELAGEVLDLLNDIGIFCIEMFLDCNDQLFINEIAPRPHNSGHFTIEACITSQYEQLLRVITGMPLGTAKLLSPCVMVNILGDINIEFGDNFMIYGIDKVLDYDELYIHLYGKSTVSTLKKLGHITVLRDCVESAERIALDALEEISITKSDK